MKLVAIWCFLLMFVLKSNAQVGKTKDEILNIQKHFKEVQIYPDYIYVSIDTNTMVFFNFSNNHCNNITLFGIKKEPMKKFINDFSCSKNKIVDISVSGSFYIYRIEEQIAETAKYQFNK